MFYAFKGKIVFIPKKRNLRTIFSPIKYTMSNISHIKDIFILNVCLVNFFGKGKNIFILL
jgi:hypothetical protein